MQMPNYEKAYLHTEMSLFVFKTFLFVLLISLSTTIAKAQVLDTVEVLMAHGRIVDAKQYLDAITDPATQNTIQYQLTKAKLYKELFKQSLQLFGIKNNNWLVTSCNAYVDGVSAMAKYTRIPDSLFVHITECYEHTSREAALEYDNGSIGMAEDLFYSAHYSSTLWSVISGHSISDTTVLYNIGMYFYHRGTSGIEYQSQQENLIRAKYYLQPLAIYKREDVLEALKTIEERVKK